MRLVLSCLALLALVLPAAARPLDRAELRGLEQAVGAYSRAMEQADAAALTASLPPRLLRLQAGMTGQTVAALTDALATQTRAALADTRLGALETDPAGADAADATLADGTAVVWAILPARFGIDRGGARSSVQQPVLALREGRDWFLMRVDPAQQAMLAAVYPFLADVVLPQTSVSPAE